MQPSDPERLVDDRAASGRQRPKLQENELGRLDGARITCGEALYIGEAYLRGCGIRDAAADAWLLFEFVTGMSRAHFLADRSVPFGEGVRREANQNGGCGRLPNECEGASPAKAAAIRYRSLLQRRGAHTPLQHLTGEQEFMGFPFYVDEHVLVPRQDTEVLVEEALRLLGAGCLAGQSGMTPEVCRQTGAGACRLRILDLCTGSGCIAVSLAKLGPDGLLIDASDVSAAALAVARRNVGRNHAAVHLICSDLFDHITGMYDMIVSNPPYICTEGIAGLDEEVRLHEPRLSLDGHEDGLYFYRRIAAEGGAFLKDGGFLLLEIGYDQAEAVEALLREAGFEETATVKDLAGLDRVVCARKPCA